MQFILTFFFSFATWIVLSGQFDAFHLSLGVLSSVVVAITSGEFFWSFKQTGPGFKISALPKATAYFFWLLKEIVVANWHVLKLAFHPNVRQQIQPRVIRFKTDLKTDFGKFVFGNSITLTPGTVTLKIEDDMFEVHALDAIVADALPGEMERRVREVFEA